MKVLIVEDDVVQRDCLEEFLRPRGCWTDAVATVAGAVLRLKVSIPDIIIIDYILLDKTAAPFLACIREMPSCAHLPLLVVTAIPASPERDSLVEQIRQIPPARILAKPFEMVDLFAALCEMTGKFLASQPLSAPQPPDCPPLTP